MTSRISYSKLIRRTIKEQASMIFVSCVYAVLGVFLSIFTVQSELMRLSYDVTSQVSRPGAIAHLFDPTNSYMQLCFAIILGSLFAFSGLRHLHSRSQTDFYGSLPITRKIHLTVIFFSSLIIYVVPVLGQILLNVLAVTFTGAMSFAALMNMLLTFVLSVIGFIMSFFTAAIAVILTGHIFIGLLGLCVFFGYFPLVLRYLIPCFESMFFTTYASTGFGPNSNLSFCNYLSPVTLLWNLFSSGAQSAWSLAGSFRYLIAALIETILLVFFAYKLYQKRPAEAAGSAMAFPKYNGFWSVLFIVPATLYTGYFFACITYESQAKYWIIPGAIFGAVLFSVLIEALFYFDLKAVFQHKKLCIGTFLFSMLFLAVFWFDLIGFDSWTPERDDVTKISFDYNGQLFRPDRTYISSEEISRKIAEHMGIEGDQLDKAYELALQYVAQGHDSSIYESEQDKHYEDVIVAYTLKSGRTYYRCYTVVIDPEDPLLSELFKEESFKDDIFPVYALSSSDLERADWYDGIGYSALNFDADEMDRFLETYKKDLSNMEFSEYTTKAPLSSVEVSTPKGSSYDAFSLYIYPSFQNTIAFLKDFDVTATDTWYTNLHILELIVDDYSKDGDENYRITDSDEINTLLPELFYDEFSLAIFSGNAVKEDDNYVTVRTSNGNTFYGSFSDEGMEMLRNMK